MRQLITELLMQGSEVTLTLFKLYTINIGYLLIHQVNDYLP